MTNPALRRHRARVSPLAQLSAALGRYIAHTVSYAYIGTVTRGETGHTLQGSCSHISFCQDRTAMAGAWLTLALVRYVKSYLFEVPPFEYRLSHKALPVDALHLRVRIIHLGLGIV